MAHKACLGLHAGESGYTAVLVELPEGRLAPFTVTPVDNVEDAGPLAMLLGEEARRRWAKLPPVALALGARCYQSQYHQTEFTDERQIRSTLKYDVEEEFSLDAEAGAVCYQRLSASAGPARLLVHAARRERLVEILDALENAGVDPLAALPDLAAWEIYLRRLAGITPGQTTVVVGRTSGALYLIFLDAQLNTIQARSVLVSPAEADTVLQLELRRSLPLLGPENRPQRLYYHAHQISAALVSALARAEGLSPQPLPQDEIEVAFAAGAARAWLEEAPVADFRDDDLPSRTLQQVHQKHRWGLSAALSLLLVCLISLLLIYQRQYHKIEKAGYDEMIGLYKKVSNGRSPKNVNTIKGELSSVKKELLLKLGANSQSEPGSAANTWLFLLQGIEGLPEKFDLQIDGMNCSPERVLFSGSVPNLETYVQLEKALTQQNFILDSTNLTKSGSGQKGDPTTRRKFVMPLLANRPPNGVAANK